MPLACLSLSCRENYLKKAKEQGEHFQSTSLKPIASNSQLCPRDKEVQEWKMERRCLRLPRTSTSKLKTGCSKSFSTLLTHTGFSKPLKRATQMKKCWYIFRIRTRTRSTANSICSLMPRSVLATWKSSVMRKSWSKLTTTRTISLIVMWWGTLRGFARKTFWKLIGNSSVTLATPREIRTTTSTKSILVNSKGPMLIKARPHLMRNILKNDFN